MDVVCLLGAPIVQPLVKPYSVLGTTRQNNTPDVPPHTVIVDPAGLWYIEHTFEGAGGVSGPIYDFLAQDTTFNYHVPSDVSDTIKKPCQAKWHMYGSQAVIHVVGPNFCKEPYKNSTTEQATSTLATAYFNVFNQFLANADKAGATTLRMLPISTGVFRGKVLKTTADKANVTRDAVKLAANRLTPEQQRKLLRYSLEMCIYEQEEQEAFRKMFGSIS